MAYAATTAAIAAQQAMASALCLPTSLIKVTPETFLNLSNDLFSIVHGRDRSHHVYFGRYLDCFLIYTRSPKPLKVVVEVESIKITKTIRL
jgi:hypothetical protein